MNHKRVLKMVLLLAVATFVVALPSVARAESQPMSSQDRIFVDGLLDRGLLTLAEEFLQQLQERNVDPVMVNARRIIVQEAQAQRQPNEELRNQKFAEAAKSYEQTVAAMGDQIKQTTDPRAQDKLRHEQMKLRLKLGEMLWQKQAFNQLNLIEITDGSGGDPEKLRPILRKSLEVMRELNAESIVWHEEMDRDPDFGRRYGELYGQIEMLKHYSSYQVAWVSYYLAFVLPQDDEERKTLLTNAIDRFGMFADSEGKSEGKIQSLRGRGMCYRQQGEWEKAESDFRNAIELSESEQFKIQVFYDLAQTHLLAKRYTGALSTLNELRGQNYESLPQSFIGSQLMPFMEARILVAEGASDDAKRQQGLRILGDLWQKGGVWRDIVAAEVKRHMPKGADRSKMSPLELWVLATDAFEKKELKEAAELFAQYLKITPQEDPMHQEAKFNVAACYARLSTEADDGMEKMAMMKKAAESFRGVAEAFPNSPVADTAVEHYVDFSKEVYLLDKSKEHAEAFGKAVKWTLDNRPKIAAAGDMQFLYGNIQRELGQYREAAAAFEKVPKSSPNYNMALFSAMESFRLYLLEQLPKMSNPAEVKREVDQAVSKTEQFVSNVDSLPAGETKEQLSRDAAMALIIAADILSRPEVKEYERGRAFIDRYQKDYGQYDDYLGEALKIKVDCLVGSGVPDEAMKLIDEIMVSVEDPMPILQNLFRSITQDIERLNRTMQREAAGKRLQDAVNIGERLKQQLAKPPVSEISQFRIDAIQYELALLYMNSGRLAEAVKRFEALCYQPYERFHEIKNLDARHMKGLATATQMQAAETRDEAAAHELYKKAAYYWQNMADSMQATQRAAKVSLGSETDPQKKAQLEKRVEEFGNLYWEFRLNQMQAYLALHPLEQKLGGEKPFDYKGAVQKFLAVERSLNSKFGGESMKLNFDRMARELGM